MLPLPRVTIVLVTITPCYNCPVLLLPRVTIASRLSYILIQLASEILLSFKVMVKSRRVGVELRLNGDF